MSGMGMVMTGAGGGIVQPFSAWQAVGDGPTTGQTVIATSTWQSKSSDRDCHEPRHLRFTRFPQLVCTNDFRH